MLENIIKLFGAFKYGITNTANALIKKYQAFRHARIYDREATTIANIWLTVTTIAEILENTSHTLSLPIDAFSYEGGKPMKKGTYVIIGQTKVHRVKHLRIQVLHVDKEFLVIKVLSKNIVNKDVHY